MPWKLKVSGTKAYVKVMPNRIEDKMNNVRQLNSGKGDKNPPHADANLPKCIRKLWTP
jgi:hypothetical protein